MTNVNKHEFLNILNKYNVYSSEDIMKLDNLNDNFFNSFVSAFWFYPPDNLSNECITELSEKFFDHDVSVDNKLSGNTVFSLFSDTLNEFKETTKFYLNKNFEFGFKDFINRFKSDLDFLFGKPFKLRSFWNLATNVKKNNEFLSVKDLKNKIDKETKVLSKASNEMLKNMDRNINRKDNERG